MDTVTASFCSSRQGEPVVQVRGASRGIRVRAHCPGRDRMEAGKPVIYIESMKLGIPVLSDDAGTVRELQAVAILED